MLWAPTADCFVRKSDDVTSGMKTMGLARRGFCLLLTDLVLITI